MPIYEYHCSSCESGFEKLVKIRSPTPPCPECGSTEVEKLVSAVGFILKGGGWYKDHYGLKSSGPDKGSSDKGSSDKGSSDKGSSDKGSSDKGSSGAKTESAGSKAKAISKAASSAGD